MKDLTKLCEWYENLSEESLGRIGDFYDKGTFFKDPFNEVRSREKMERIFKEMFENLDNPHFVIIDTIHEGDQAFLTWDFIFTNKGNTYTIHGSSHLKMNEFGLIIYHRDYWDVGEELLLKIPLIRNLYGMLRKKLSGNHS